MYLAAADGILLCKKYDFKKLPLWSRGYRNLLLCQLSSAAVERVFSLLKNFFREEQTNSLETNRSFFNVTVFSQCHQLCLDRL